MDGFIMPITEKGDGVNLVISQNGFGSTSKKLLSHNNRYIKLICIVTEYIYILILQIEHKVPNYDGWKKVFDSDPVNRERQEDDPDNVIVGQYFDNSGE